MWYRHDAVPISSKLPAFWLFISPSIILFIIIRDSLYTGIVMIFSQPSISRTGIRVYRHVAVPIYGKLPAFLLFISPIIILFIIIWHSRYTGIVMFFSQPSININGTGVYQHVALPIYGKLPVFLPLISPSIILFIIIRHSLYTGIVMIFSQPGISRTGTGVYRHVAVPIYGKLRVFLPLISPSIILIIIIWHSLYTGILIIFSRPGI